jgi:hypothetical protein
MKIKNFFFKIKKCCYACFVWALLTTAPLLAQDVTTGLKLHYSFDAVTGTMVTDDSGNAANGTLYGGATIVSGKDGNGVQFPVLGDYMQLPNDITTSLTDFTFAAWVKMDGAIQTQTRIFDFGASVTSGDPQKYFLLSANGWNGVPRFCITTGSWNNEQGVEGNKALPIGTWTHIAVTLKGGTATIYMNGAVVGQAVGWTLTPSSLGATDQNFLAKSQWAGDTHGSNNTVDDVRIYDRALTANDLASLLGLGELKKQQDALTLGDISAVKSDITLPLTMGTQDVVVKWISSNPSMIDSLGHLINKPSTYNTPVLLTAMLSKTINAEVYTLPKEFIATVSALNPILTSELVANWNFTASNIIPDGDTIRIKDASESGFIGKLMNLARVKTIGNTKQFNVLDLGNNQGYFDMGAKIGEAIYSLNDFTVSGYFRMDETYTGNGDWGNNLFSFSNTENDLADPKGTIYACLGKTNYAISAGSWSYLGETSINPSKAPTTGNWHHYAYTQNGSVGSIYFDGILLSSGSIGAHPFNTLRRDGKTGTIFNWIGRPPYGAPDSYLSKTLVYGLQVYNVPLTVDDMTSFLGVPDTIAALNNAYIENPEFTTPALVNEQSALTLGDLSAVTTNIVLPSKGTIDNSISIIWKSSNTNLISNSGIVIQPDYYNYNDTLTATLLKDGQTLTKSFVATVLVKPNTQFNNDLLVKYDFSTITDSTVTDVAEKHLKGVLKNNARVHSIGLTNKYNVLNLGDSIGYFDMGQEIGKLMYNLNDYTISAYYRINAEYTGLSSLGNFLFSFSNGNAQSNDKNGYLICSLHDQSMSITPNSYTAESGNQSLALGTTALVGGWHHLAYTQSGTVGTIYLDGVPMLTQTITNTPKTTLPKTGKLGTIFNWIGRSCYSGDAYLRKTMVYDFRLYRKALRDTDIQMDVLNVGNTILALDEAYTEDATATKKVVDSYYSVISLNGKISITGLSGKENISIMDITGRQLKLSTNKNKVEFAINSGVYLVKVDNTTSKVIIK